MGVAASVQACTENVLLSLATWLQEETGMKNLAYAGGVALNCVANTNIKNIQDLISLQYNLLLEMLDVRLGAAALNCRPNWENAYLGVTAITELH